MGATCPEESKKDFKDQRIMFGLPKIGSILDVDEKFDEVGSLVRKEKVSEGVSDNIDFRFHYIGKGEPVKVINQGGKKKKKPGRNLHSRKINFVVGFESKGLRRLARILLFSR